MSKKSLAALTDKQDLDMVFAVLPTLHGENKGSFIPVPVAAQQLEKEGFGVYCLGSFMLKQTNIEKHYGRPDPQTLTKMSWRPNMAWIQCNVYHDGKPYPQCPRQKLIEMREKAKSLGFYMKAGFEAEFQLLEKDKHEMIESMKDGACYQSPYESMGRVDFIKEVLQTMTKLGWKPYQAEHECAIGQYEINYDFAEALTAADRHSFFKFMIKEISRSHDFRATFMPFPFSTQVLGNGLHINLSLWDSVKDINLMPGEKVGESDSGLAPIAEHFVAGILAHAEALTAVLCPSINSYKRIYGTLMVQVIGTTTISWGRKSRYPLIRLPNNERIEIRSADCSACPYLAQAAILAAGMDGIENKIPLSKSLQMEEDQFLQKPDLSHLRTLPKTLMEACDFFAKDTAMRKYLGDEIVDSFVGVKKMHWDDYLKHLSSFETDMANEY